MQSKPRALKDHEHVMSQINGGEWLVTWHTPSNPPDGKEHGALAVCFDENENIPLISRDGQNWEFPGGRPEGEESWEETMVREVKEETCATVVGCRLLGFSRGVCLSGHEKGLVLVRSAWRADVVLEEWKPLFEIPFRAVFPQSEVRELIIAAHQDGSAPLLLRALDEALAWGKKEPITTNAS